MEAMMAKAHGRRETKIQNRSIWERGLTNSHSWLIDSLIFLWSSVASLRVFPGWYEMRVTHLKFPTNKTRAPNSFTCVMSERIGNWDVPINLESLNNEAGVSFGVNLTHPKQMESRCSIRVIKKSALSNDRVQRVS